MKKWKNKKAKDDRGAGHKLFVTGEGEEVLVRKGSDGGGGAVDSLARSVGFVVVAVRLFFVRS